MAIEESSEVPEATGNSGARASFRGPAEGTNNIAAEGAQCPASSHTEGGVESGACQGTSSTAGKALEFMASPQLSEASRNAVEQGEARERRKSNGGGSVMRSTAPDPLGAGDADFRSWSREPVPGGHWVMRSSAPQGRRPSGPGTGSSVRRHHGGGVGDAVFRCS